MTEPVSGAAVPCLLSYRLDTTPSPLEASTDKADRPGTIDAWVTRPAADPVYCDQITLGVPRGTGPADFTDRTISVRPSCKWWTLSSVEDVPGSEIGLDPSVTLTTFRFTCDRHHTLIDYELYFEMYTEAVGRSTQSFTFSVAERSGTDAAHLSARRCDFVLERVAPRLRIEDFFASDPPAEGVGSPRGEFPAGTPIRFSWGGNGDHFELYRAGTRIHAGPDTSFTYDDGVTRDTTFTLIATAAGSAARVAATLTLTVSNPVLEPESVTAGTVQASGRGTFEARASMGSAVVTEGLYAPGAFTARGAATAAGATGTATTQLHGEAKLAGADLSGKLVVTGAAALGQATVSRLTVGESTKLMKSPTGLECVVVETYRALSDGMVIGTVYGTGAHAWERSHTVLEGWTEHGVGGAASGGNTLLWGREKCSKREFEMAYDSGTFTMPVKNGALFSIRRSNDGAAAVSDFAWIGFGTESRPPQFQGDQAVQAAAGAAPPPVVAVEPPTPEARTAPLVEAITDLFGADRVPPRLQDRLTAALATLATRVPADPKGEPR